MMYTITTPGILKHVEVPTKDGVRYFKPLHAGPPYNTIVTVLVDDNGQITLTDDRASTFVEIKRPRNESGSLRSEAVRVVYEV
jgi:hypothetical protein